MIRKLLFVLLAAVLSSGSFGCCMCDHVDDYSGCYYGGVVGNWDGDAGRAGSALSGGHSSAAPILTEHE
jgi:hypothetical protein